MEKNNNEYSIKIGQIIRSLRESNGLTQRELADRLGVTEKAVSSWEVGSSSPRLNKITKMSELFDFDIVHHSIKADISKSDKDATDIAIEYTPGQPADSFIKRAGSYAANLSIDSDSKLSLPEKERLIQLLAKLDVNQLQRVRNYINMLIDLKQ